MFCLWWCAVFDVHQALFDHQKASFWTQKTRELSSVGSWSFPKTGSNFSLKVTSLMLLSHNALTQEISNQLKLPWPSDSKVIQFALPVHQIIGQHAMAISLFFISEAPVSINIMYGCFLFYQRAYWMLLDSEKCSESLPSLSCSLSGTPSHPAMACTIILPCSQSSSSSSSWTLNSQCASAPPPQVIPNPLT